MPEPADPSLTTATAATSLPVDTERRLHPGSWLFVLLQNLRQFIVPLAVLLFAGRGSDRYPWWLPLVGVGALVVVSVWQYLTFRYRIADDRLIVRSGLLERSVRQIPYSRIHNVAIHQSLLHRLMRVAEVRLESAGGQKPEAQMRVLRLPEALALEQLIRDRGQGDATPATADAPVDHGDTLLALSTIEVVKLGLISNRGMIVVAGAVALSFQVLPERALGAWVRTAGRDAFGYASGVATTWMAKALAIAALLVLLLALIRVLSVALALVRYHGFTLQRLGRRLTVERGLLSRSRSSVPRRRIQAWTLREGVLHRLFGRRALEIDTATARGSDGQGGGDARGLDALAPIAPPAVCDAIVRDVARLPTWPPSAWQSLHPHAWLRLWLGDIVLAVLLCAAIGWFFQWWGLVGVAWLAWSAFVARRHAARAGFSLDDDVIAVREGWWTRHWRFAEIDKVQAVELRQSPLDRRFGMAAVWLDTAGANPLAPQLRLRYVPLDVAQRVHASLAHEIAQRPLRW